jgi:hypothetical protein
VPFLAGIAIKFGSITGHKQNSEPNGQLSRLHLHSHSVLASESLQHHILRKYSSVWEEERVGISKKSKSDIAAETRASKSVLSADFGSLSTKEW